jgi:hypothetical protein
MRRTILLSLFVFFAVSAVNDAFAQRYGGAGHGFAHRGYGFNRGRGRAVLPYGFGYADLPDNFDTGGSYAPQPVVVIQQPPPPVVRPSAPPVVQPSEYLVVKEYKWPAAGTASSPSAASTSASNAQDFAIVLKDGSSLSAVAVFVSDDGLHYVDPDQRQMRISMSEIDRAATVKLNRERNLNLQLPAAE